MAGIAHKIFGYRIITSECGKEHKLATILLSLGIAAEDMGCGTFLIRARDFRRFSRGAAGRVRYTASELLGLPGVIYQNRVRSLSLISVIFGIILNIFLSNLVWDVRVIGNRDIEGDVIAEKLEASGLKIGTSWQSLDKNEVETALLAAMPDVSWISINRRGTVAYVEVRERADVPSPDNGIYPPSNIVALKDCVIEEITVKSGVAMVAPGSVVRAGDMLISGIVTTESGTQFVRAEGSVRAHVADKIVTEVKREEIETIEEEYRVCERTLNILGVRINIYKNYGNLPDGCDIIEDKENITLPGGKKLPLSLVTSRAVSQVNITTTYTDSELPALAAMRLEEKFAEILSNKDLIKLKTDGEYTELGYRITASIVTSEDVGKEVKIEFGY